MKYINNDNFGLTSLSPSAGWKRAKLAHEMYSLNDRLLADIGICRDEIQYIVEKSYPHARMWDVLKGMFHKWVEARKHRLTARTLADFDDRMLVDIGLQRSDISSIAKGYYPARHAHSINLMGLGFGSSSNANAVNDDHRHAA